MRILFLPSHVGLGHAARDLAVARALRRLKPSVTVEWCSAEPAVSLVRAWGERIAGGCPELGSFSPIVEEFSEKGARSMRSARNGLRILEKNYRLVEPLLGGYDSVFADEFWELVYSAPATVKERVVFGTDLVYMPYAASPAKLLLSLVLNAYFKKALLGFKQLLFLNDPETLGEARWYLAAGGRVKDWVEKHAVATGLVTSYAPGELPERGEARRRLGLGEEDFFVVVSVGGTSARSTRLLNAVDEAAPSIASRTGRRTVIVAVTGPRTSWKPRSSFIRLDPYPRSLAQYYAAADVMLTRAGRTTTADIICSGIGAVLVPIRGHMEQEHIARDAARRHGYRVLEEDELSPGRLAEALLEEAGRKRMRLPCRGVERTARALLNMYGGSWQQAQLGRRSRSLSSGNPCCPATASAASQPKTLA